MTMPKLNTPQPQRAPGALLLLGVVMFSLALPSGTGRAARDIFSPAINRAVDDAVSAWQQGRRKEMIEALNRFTVNEARLLAVGLSNDDNSYLRRMPTACTRTETGVAACLYFLREERRSGVDMLDHRKFFAGRKFLLVMPGEDDAVGEDRR